MPLKNAMKDFVKDRFIGSILGLAIGDALGMPFEGWYPAQIRASWKDRNFQPAPYRGLDRGQYTDDTLMAICHIRSLIDSGRVEPEDIARKFIQWYDSGNLRGIGSSTAYALRRQKQGYTWDKSGAQGEYAAGNGGAMRIAPVGLFYHNQLPSLKEAVRLAVTPTHNNPEAIAGAAAVAYLVARAVRGDLDLDTALRDTIDFVGDSKVSDNLLKAEEMLKGGLELGQALAVLGTSGYVVETVASAAYCFLSSPKDFESTVVSAVLGGIDADTTAAVAGSISGAYNGVRAIPQAWLKGVESSALLSSLAEDLYEVWGKLVVSPSAVSLGPNCGANVKE